MGSGASASRKQKKSDQRDRLSRTSSFSEALKGLKGHLNGDDLQTLRALLQDVKTELKRELKDELRLEFESQVAQVANRMSTQIAGQTVKQEPVETSGMEAITYDEAFQAIGGDEELWKYADLPLGNQSQELEEELRELLPIDYTKRSGFSTRLINQPFVQNMEELYARANEIYPDFDDAVRQLAQRTKSKAVVPPIKGETRARMKAIFKYADPSSDGVAWYRLTDLVRATLEFSNIADLYAGLKEVTAFFGEDVKELNDRYQKPMSGGYRDIQMVISFQGHMCELQLNTEPMLRAKMTTGHRDFEVVRELKAAVKNGSVGRVNNAFEFARDHLGSTTGGGAVALRKLLQSDDASTLQHQAAKAGHAEILYAFLLHGADVNAQDASGNTPLHLAVFGGHERCVWVVLDVGKPDLDIQNRDGQTALVMGYLMLWQRPPENAVRAVSTLAQVAGVKRIKDAREVVDEQRLKRLKPSRMLVDFAAVGNVEKMLQELCDYADPNSRDKDNQSALEAAIMNGNEDALELLLDFKVSLTPWMWTKIPPKTRADNPKMMKMLVSAGAPHVRVVGGPWPPGMLSMVPLKDGEKHYTDRDYKWEGVPSALDGVAVTLNPCRCAAKLQLKVAAHDGVIGVLIAHGALNRCYVHEAKALMGRLAAMGFSKETVPFMRTTSFGEPGMDLWQLPVRGSKEVTIVTHGDMELNICLPQYVVKMPCCVEVVRGSWPKGFLKMVRLREGVKHYTDREYVYTEIPHPLEEWDISQNPCHSGKNLNLKMTPADNTLAVMIPHGKQNGNLHSAEKGLCVSVKTMEEVEAATKADRAKQAVKRCIVACIQRPTAPRKELIFFFHSRNWLLWDFSPDRIADGPKPWSAGWFRPLPEPFSNNFDTVCEDPANPRHLLFFYGDSILRWDFSPDRPLGVKPIAEVFPGMHDTFCRDIDAAVRRPTGVQQIILFKGDDWVCYDTNQKKVVEGPFKLKERWFAALPPPFDKKIDAVVRRPTAENKELIFFSEDQWLLWDFSPDRILSGPNFVDSGWFKNLGALEEVDAPQDEVSMPPLNERFESNGFTKLRIPAMKTGSFTQPGVDFFVLPVQDEREVSIMTNRKASFEFNLCVLGRVLDALEISGLAGLEEEDINVDSELAKFEQEKMTVEELP